jgi:hypothetical protein
MKPKPFLNFCQQKYTQNIMPISINLTLSPLHGTRCSPIQNGLESIQFTEATSFLNFFYFFNATIQPCRFHITTKFLFIKVLSICSNELQNCLIGYNRPLGVASSPTVALGGGSATQTSQLGATQTSRFGVAETTPKGHH